jgi:hypothetical protein
MDGILDSEMLFEREKAVFFFNAIEKDGKRVGDSGQCSTPAFEYQDRMDGYEVSF